jgi:hypothetical protein
MSIILYGKQYDNMENTPTPKYESTAMINNTVTYVLPNGEGFIALKRRKTANTLTHKYATTKTAFNRFTLVERKVKSNITKTCAKMIMELYKYT